MGSPPSIRDLHRIPHDSEVVSVSSIDPAATPGVKSEKKAAKDLKRHAGQLEELHDRLYAEKTQSLLLVLQGMDTSGKDGTVKHVLGQIDPLGVRMRAFKVPTAEEKRHGFLWRFDQALPEPGGIGIFNRSQYEDVLVARVKRLAPPDVIDRRYGEINRWEQRLVERGTKVVKVMLHISNQEQKRRLAERLLDPDKHWKFSPADITERALWDDYQAAYDLALARCSTAQAPWCVIPADNKWYRDWAVSHLLLETLSEMNPQYPRPRLAVKRLLRNLGVSPEEAKRLAPS